MKYNTSLFSQIFQLIPRTTFERLIRETKSEDYTKGFSCWTQCVAMLFCQFTQSKSLREISDGLRITNGKLNHLRLKAAPCKSTLSNANAHRPAELYSGSLPNYSSIVTPRVQEKSKNSASRIRSIALMLPRLTSACPCSHGPNSGRRKGR